VQSQPASDGSPRIELLIEDCQLVAHGALTVAHRMTSSCVESSTGEIERFSTNSQVGPVLTRCIGRLEGDQFTIETWRGGRAAINSIPWRSTYRGFAAVEQSLRSKPIELGEVRLLQTLVPLQNQVYTLRLDCTSKAAAAMLDGSTPDLLETNVSVSMDKESVAQTVLWTNEAGQTLKSYTAGVEVLTFQSDEASAKESIVAHPCSESGVSLAVQGTIERLDQAKRTGYLIKGANSKTGIDLFSAPGQYVRKTEDGSIQVLVDTWLKSPPGFLTYDQKATPNDIAANVLIDVGSPQIQKLRQAATQTTLSGREMAQELARLVKQVIAPAPQLRGLVPASEVAQAGTADATGYAVLLTALLRANGIPARVVFGVSLARPEAKHMTYHAWTTALFENQWTLLDATVVDGVMSNRLAFWVSDLADESAPQTLLQRLAELGKCQVKILKTQY
jgi:hypothetical protein